MTARSGTSLATRQRSPRQLRHGLPPPAPLRAVPPSRSPTRTRARSSLPPTRSPRPTTVIGALRTNCAPLLGQALSGPKCSSKVTWPLPQAACCGHDATYPATTHDGVKSPSGGTGRLRILPVPQSRSPCEMYKGRIRHWWPAGARSGRDRRPSGAATQGPLYAISTPSASIREPAERAYPLPEESRRPLAGGGRLRGGQVCRALRRC